MVVEIPILQLHFYASLIRISFRISSITSLPESLTELKKLKVIVLMMNRFTHFPEILCKLPSLEIIDLSINKIERIPECVLNLNNLKKLNVTSNPVFLNLSKDTKKIFQELDDHGVKISGWMESSSHKKRIKEFEIRKTNALQNQNIEIIEIGYSLQLIYFFNEFLNLERHLKMENLPGLPAFKENLIKTAKLRLLENFNNFKSQGFFKDKSFDLIRELKHSEGSLDLINRFGDEFSIQFNNKRIRKIEYNIWEDSEDDDIILPYNEVHIIPSTEVYDFSNIPQGSLNTPLPDRMFDFINPKQLHLKGIGGITSKDLQEAFNYRLPDYGDYTFFEVLDYYWDYKGVPVYSLFIGS